MENFKHKNFTYSKYHKSHKIAKLHVDKLIKGGLKVVDGMDKKTANAFTFVEDNDKGGVWVVYRFGKNDKEITFKKGDKFYFAESVSGKGIVEISKVTPDTFKRPNNDSYDLKGVNFTYFTYNNSYDDMIEMIENKDLKPIKK